MRMENPIPTFEYLIQQLHDQFPQLAYLHLVEPRIAGDKDTRGKNAEVKVDSNDFAKRIWGERPYISAGGYTPERAVERVETYGGLVAFGRLFLANVSLCHGSSLRHSADHAVSLIYPRGLNVVHPSIYRIARPFTQLVP
jgi:NADPH2 dehydrogenase